MENRTSPIFWFFLALFIASCILLGWLFSPFLPIIVLGMVVTGIFNPVYQFLTRKLRPSLASLVTCVAIFVVLFVPLVICVGILANEARDLFLTAKAAVLRDDLKNVIESSGLFERANTILAKFDIQFSADELFQEIPKIARGIGLFLIDQAGNITNDALMFFANFFFMLLIVFFLLIDSGKLVSFITELSPLPDDQDEHLIRKFKDMAGAIIVGNGFCGLLQGIVGGTLFQFLGIKSAFLWGVLMGLLAFLPIVGIGLVFIPTSLILMLQGKVATGIFMLCFYVFLSGGVEYLLKPKLVGDRVRMHTLLVFLSIMGGLKLFGILGIIYGPLIVTAFLTLTDIYHSSYQMFVEPVPKIMMDRKPPHLEYDRPITDGR